MGLRSGIKPFLFLLIIGGLSWADGGRDFVSRGDLFYAHREDLSRAIKAFEYYKKALAVDPTRVEAYWKAAKVLFWIGSHEKEKKKALYYFRQEIEFGKLCVSLAPKDPHCHYWLAVGYGKFGETKGIMESLYLLPYMCKEFEATIKLDPDFRKGEAYADLGYVYAKLPSVLPSSIHGDDKKADEYFAKALKIGPDHVANHLLLARVLVKRGNKKEAKRELEYVLKAPLEPGLEPEQREFQEEARWLLKGFEE